MKQIKLHFRGDYGTAASTLQLSTTCNRLKTNFSTLQEATIHSFILVAHVLAAFVRQHGTDAFGDTFRNDDTVAPSKATVLDGDPLLVVLLAVEGAILIPITLVKLQGMQDAILMHFRFKHYPLANWVLVQATGDLTVRAKKDWFIHFVQSSLCFMVGNVSIFFGYDNTTLLGRRFWHT